MCQRSQRPLRDGRGQLSQHADAAGRQQGVHRQGNRTKLFKDKQRKDQYF